MSKRRVLVVDDHPLYADALVSILRRLSPELVVRRERSAEVVLRDLAAVQPYDLIVLDLGLPGLAGERAFEAIQAAAPRTPIAIVTADDDAALAHRLLAGGARGYLPKSLDPPAMSEALRAVLDGGTYVPPSMVGHEAANEPTLTGRQREVLVCIACGASNAEIAEELGIAEATVRVHVTIVLRALGVKSRTQAAVTPLARRLAAERRER
jgi:DNA-binding NarL/FixJ family response regulator